MIWALADLHLSFGVPGKEMDVFGPEWKNHPEKIHQTWCEKVKEDDLILLPGDISWAMRAEQVVPDLKWLDQLPGTKVMIRGNHDYWWSTIGKVRKLLPASIIAIQNDVFEWQGVEIAGARLWDSEEYNFNDYILFKESDLVKEKHHDPKESERIFERELGRLELSLRQFSPSCTKRVAMTHYPPIGADLKPSRAHQLLKKYGVSHCLFGHLHSVKAGSLPFGEYEGVQYTLTSCDYLQFEPYQVNIL